MYRQHGGMDVEMEEATHASDDVADLPRTLDAVELPNARNWHRVTRRTDDGGDAGCVTRRTDDGGDAGCVARRTDDGGDASRVFPFQTLFAWLVGVNLWARLTGGIRAVFSGGGPCRDGLQVSAAGKAAIAEGNRLAMGNLLSLDRQKPYFSSTALLEGEWQSDLGPTPFAKLDSEPEAPRHKGVLVLVGTYPGALLSSCALALASHALSLSRSLAFALAPALALDHAPTPTVTTHCRLGRDHAATCISLWTCATLMNILKFFKFWHHIPVVSPIRECYKRQHQNDQPILTLC